MFAFQVLRVLTAVSILTFSLCAFAASSSRIDEIVAEQRDIRSRVEADEIDLSKRDRARLLREQDRIFTLAEGHDTIDDLNPVEQIELRNSIESVAALLAETRADRDSQEVCWRDRQSGSKIMTTVCGTRGEVADLREGARDYLSRPRVCVPPGCG